MPFAPVDAVIAPYRHEPDAVKLTLIRGGKFVSSTIHPTRDAAERAALKLHARITHAAPTQETS